MGTGRTTGRGLPFPVESDAPADPATDIEALANALDADLEFRSGTAGAKGAAPAHAVAYFETDTGKLALAVGSAWTYPAPSIAALSITTALLADDAVDDAKIADVDGTKIHANSAPGSALQDNTIPAAKIAAALKPSAGAGAGAETLRALGGTGSTAAAGNDARLSDTRVPTDASVTWAKLAAVLIGGLPGGANKLMASDDARVVGPAAKDDRLQPGVVDPSANLTVSGPLAPGSTITIAAGPVWLKDPNGLLQRHVLALVDTSKSLGASPAAGHSRVDVLYAVYNGPGLAPTFSYVQGADQAAVLGASYSTAGAGAAPANSIPLALFLFSNTAGGALTITRFDRRIAAGGATRSKATGAVVSTGGGANPGAIVYSLAVELSGAPVEFSYGGTFSQGNSAANSDVNVMPALDGAVLPGYGANDLARTVLHNVPWQVYAEYSETVIFAGHTPGRHSICINMWTPGTGYSQLDNGQISIRELVGSTHIHGDQ